MELLIGDVRKTMASATSSTVAGLPAGVSLRSFVFQIKKCETLDPITFDAESCPLSDSLASR
jgi:hypothetical protein